MERCINRNERMKQNKINKIIAGEKTEEIKNC